jgi:MFS family permease
LEQSGEKNRLERERSHFRLYLYTSFVPNIAGTLFYVFTPLLAIQVGANPLEVGLVGGSANAVYTFMPFVMGHFSDRRGSRLFFTTSAFSILVIVSLLYYSVTNPISLILERVLEGLGWAMLWPAVEAGVSQDKTRDTARVFPLFNLSWSSAAALSPLIGAFVVLFASLRLAFVFTALVILAVLIPNLISILGERKQNRLASGSARNQLPRHSIMAGLQKILGSGNAENRFHLRFMLACTILAGVTYGVMFTFAGPFGHARGFSVLFAGEITFAFGIARILSFLTTTHEKLRLKILERSKRNRNALLGVFVAALPGLLFLTDDPTTVAYFVAFIIAGAGYAFLYSISQATIIVEAEPDTAGAGAGLFESMIGTGEFFGPVAAGAISASVFRLAFTIPTLALIVLLVVSSVLYIRMKRSQETSSRKETASR